jgi:hypothetical protein
MSKYQPIINKLFDDDKSFIKEDFIEFIEDLTWNTVQINDIKKSKSSDASWNEYYKEEYMVYEDKAWEKIAIMSYKMPSTTKVEKARSYQRNLISNYLKNEWVFDWIDSVLVAFYNENSSDWRLSFVKQEFKLDNWKIINELTPAKRYSFLVESKSKNITVKQRLNELILNRGLLISDIEKAFSVEKVSKEFFDQYVKLYEKLVLAFKEDNVFLKIESESNNWDENFRENFVKKLLWQIVFLYFLQKKWWLWVPKDWKWWEWNKRFLQDLLAECLGWWDESKELWWKNFFNDYLEHLFYANLNQKRENDYSEYFKCRIPYLNWWLFEPINNYHWKGFEYVVLAWEKNNILFKDIFATFDDYNFTVYENDPLEQDVAVDPEMLGKVFENLLPENERKGKWAFYTPREIVHYMCKESLKNHIINKTWITEDKINWLFERKDSMYNSKKFGKELSSDERYTQFWEFIDYAENIVTSLKTVKIVDPAVWSWAFPMGLLKEIVSLRKYLQENILLEDNVSEYQIKKETLENCIYWVDLDPGAVEIAKLRFWLSLVIEEESGDNIDPLPNLDYKIMQWNSLIEDIVVWDTVIKLDLENNTKKLTKKEEKEFWNMTQWSMSLFADETIRDDILKRLKFLHKIFFQEKDNNKKKNLKIEIDHIEKELIRISWEVEVNRIKSQIDNIEWKYIISWMAWDEKDAKKVAEFYSQISSIKEMEEKYKRDNIRSFFPWKLHFWEVFNDNWGFDIVIGNPPYIDSEEMVKSQLKEREYISRNYDFTKWNWDIYIAFFEKWFKLLSEKGTLSYITPDKWLSKPFWIELRANLISNIDLIVRAWRDVFETAKVDSIISFFQNKKVNEIKVYEYTDNNFEYIIDIKKKWIKEPFILDFIFSTYVDLLNKINLLDWTLSDISNCENACATSDAYKLKDLVFSNNNFDSNSLLKIINTWTISKFTNKWWQREMTYLKDKYLYPVVNKNEFLSIFPNSYWKKSVKPKIIIKWLTLLDWSLDLDWEYIPWKSTIIIYDDNIELLKVLSAFINSSLPIFYIKEMYSSSSYNWWINFSRDMIANLPFPNLNKEAQKPFIDLVDQILEITKKEDYVEREDLQKQVKVLESRIDDMVYKLYELTPEEIKLVEESLK